MNIKNTFLLIVAAGLMLGISSCKKGDHLDKIIAHPEFAKFGNNVVSQYFVTNSASSTFKIPVGFTTKSDVARTINFTYISSTGAAQGVQYNAPASVNIPAGGAGDTLAINGIFAGYPTGRKDTLRIRISGTDTAFYNTYILVMQKYCPVVLADLEGDYNNTREYNSSGTLVYGPYTTVVKNSQSVSATSAKVMIENIYDFGWNDIEATIDWADPGNFKVTIAKQNTGTLDGGYPLYVRSASGTNTFSSCDQTFTLTVDLVGGASGTEIIEGSYQVRIRR